MKKVQIVFTTTALTLLFSFPSYSEKVQNSGTQGQNSPPNTSLTQNTTREEVLKNTSWQIVPGARVGKNPADTLIDINNLNRQEKVITFDITGYKSFYYRLQGDCSTRQVRFLRRGLLRLGDKVNYQLVDGEEATRVVDFHRTVLDFACKQSNTQIANSPAGSSSSRKIPEGIYWVGLTGMALEVKGGQYQYRDEETTTSWKPISELTPIKDGVLKMRETYWCLSNSFPQQNRRSAVCSASGWTVSPPVASSNSNPPVIPPPGNETKQENPSNFSDALLQSSNPQPLDPNWCTSSPEQLPIGDGRARKYVDFSSACRGHDVCYFTIGANKSTCDTQFHNDLKEICRQEFTSSIPLRGQCNLNANLYYNAVSGSGIVGTVTEGVANRSFANAQREAGIVASQLSEKFPGIDIKQYHQEIASQLAIRQASGESVDDSIKNVANAISEKISTSLNRGAIYGSWNDAWGTGAWRIEHLPNTKQFLVFPPDAYARKSGRQGPYTGRFTGENQIEVQILR